MTGEGQYHIADVNVPDDDSRILWRGKLSLDFRISPMINKTTTKFIMHHSMYYLVCSEQEGCVEIDGGDEIFVRLNAAKSDELSAHAIDVRYLGC